MRKLFSHASESIKRHIDLYNRNDTLNETIIKYKIDNNEDNKIRIFGENFVINNKGKITLIIYGNEYELCEYINKDIIPQNKNILEVKLIENQQITNMSNMFSYCNSLLPISDFSNWNTRNVTDMSGMFSYCGLLKQLPDISNWYTKNVINMSQMFSYCNSLLSLPDISKWKTKHVNNMSWMFAHCESLTSLPDISRWKTKNVNNMSYMFYCCYSLVNLPGISGWKIKNVNKIVGMVGMFEGCKKSLNVPEKFKILNKKDE